ncbi:MULTISPECIES: hypothetical protein [Rahnella]|jgi:hypothetical protein|uniref:Uncharacterized protein n=1 Tax=Rahnella variigena TaxID=574964 RepID=A0ABX9PYX6_9GAMM|nr:MULTISPECIES: hypothetical protein [Rahnella]MDH2899177.1 hypothetical protein [Rahnella variigena]RJT51814.1 hypothetical protein D6D38_16500 [Rahnella variigena]RKF69742.1 hypothetical protein CKQ54_15765 [Rahnella variigena]RYJ12353.1 hypothetical protein C5Y41_23035 [Rahnella variigena]TCQ87441.1 hypothetical protein EC840_106150 [Rahnella sp. JUb53]
MSVIQAKSLHEAEDLLNSGIVKKVELAFNINSDEFFKLALECGDRGAKITKGKEHFVITFKKWVIPSNDLTATKSNVLM